MAFISLPKLEFSVGPPLEELLERRRSVRDYAPKPVTLAQAATLLWAAQGTTDREGLRTVPSAGALYPLELRIVAGDVSGLAPGIYRYLAPQGVLDLGAEGDWRHALATAALGQSWLADAPLILVFSARYSLTTGKYHQRGVQYVHIEVGHAAQNVLLMAVALNLVAAVVGAFQDERVAEVVGLNVGESPLYLLPIGYPKSLL